VRGVCAFHFFQQRQTCGSCRGSCQENSNY
jgi:hypothetical protein